MRVICVSGKARHGKDTVASFIKEGLEDRGYRVLVTHYADLLKFMCKNFFGWNGEKDEKGRKLLQYVGTDVIRTAIPNFWVDFIVDVLLLFKDEWDFVIIPDCRFPNEVERLREFGINTLLLRVIRDGFESDLNSEAINHISETALDEYDFDIVMVNRTLEELKTSVEVLVRGLVGGSEDEEERDSGAVVSEASLHK
jgi:hypothetical protein